MRKCHKMEEPIKAMATKVQLIDFPINHFQVKQLTKKNNSVQFQLVLAFMHRMEKKLDICFFPGIVFTDGK